MKLHLDINLNEIITEEGDLTQIATDMILAQIKSSIMSMIKQTIISEIENIAKAFISDKFSEWTLLTELHKITYEYTDEVTVEKITIMDKIEKTFNKYAESFFNGGNYYDRNSGASKLIESTIERKMSGLKNQVTEETEKQMKKFCSELTEASRKKVADFLLDVVDNKLTVVKK